MTTSERYVLNVVQNPTLLEIAYRSVSSGNTEQSELIDDTSLVEGDDGDGTLDQAINGLLTFGLLGKSDYEYGVEPLAFDTGDWQLDFRMTMLHNIAKEADESDWGKQSAVILNYEYLLDKTQYFQGTSSELINKIDRWHQEIGYEPRNKRGERQKLNPQKFNHWRNQAEYLGLIHPTKGRPTSYTVAPDPNLIEASIQTACKQVGDDERVEAATYVEWLGDNLLRVPLTSEKEFTEPMARTLYDLAKAERIEFVKHGDYGQVGLSGVPVSKNDQIAKDANHIKIRS